MVEHAGRRGGGTDPPASATLRGLLIRTGTAGNLVGDAHLAALALEHGATVVSFDRDMARFDGVALHVPA